jgi:hypothetical protein
MWHLPGSVITFVIVGTKQPKTPAAPVVPTSSSRLAIADEPGAYREFRLADSSLPVLVVGVMNSSPCSSSARSLGEVFSDSLSVSFIINSIDRLATRSTALIDSQRSRRTSAGGKYEEVRPENPRTRPKTQMDAPVQYTVPAENPATNPADAHSLKKFGLHRQSLQAALQQLPHRVLLRATPSTTCTAKIPCVAPAASDGPVSLVNGPSLW